MFWLVHLKYYKIITLYTIVLGIFSLTAGCTHVHLAAPERSDELVTIERHEILAAEFKKPDELISPEYESYTFFLFPNPSWVKKAKPDMLSELSKEFKDFGEAIGKRDLAIWFINDKGMPDTNAYSDPFRPPNPE